MQDVIYKKGYIAGYRDGIKAAECGKVLRWDENSVTCLPVQVMDVSSRAKNCLLHARCVYVADVIQLDERKIATMRRLGQKTASEIGQWLEEQGVFHSAWSRYISF